MGNLNARLYVFFAIWSCILLISGYQLYRNVLQFSDAAGWIAHSREVLEATQSTLTTLEIAESEERAYLITTHRSYLEPFETALKNVPWDLQRLETLTQDNPRQALRVKELRGMVAAKVEQLLETIALHQRDPASARQAVLVHEGHNVMDAIQDRVETMKREELSLLSERDQAGRHARRVALLSGVAFGGLGLAGLGGLLLQALRSTRQRERYEKEQERQRQLLLVTLRSIGDALITTNAAGAVDMMNPAAETLTGWSQAEAAGQPLERVFHIIDEETRQSAQSLVEDVLRKGTVRSLAASTALVHRDGHDVPIEDSAAPIRDAGGAVVGQVVVFHDVTERRRSVANLTQSERRFRSLTELSPNAIWVNRDDRIELANPAALRLLGLDRADQIEGMNPFQIFHRNSHEKVRERLLAVRKGQVVQTSEETVVRMDGALRQVEVSSALFEDAQGPAIQVVVRDVTERQEAARALQESEERFRRLFEISPVPYGLFQRGGRTLALNRQFERTFGYDLDDIPDLPGWWARAFPDPEAFQQAKAFWESFSTRGGAEEPELVRGGERRITCKDGTVRTVQATVLIQQDQYLVTFYDLTDRLREEEERRKVEKRMVQAQRLEALGVLVAGVAHNFNNILAIIMGTASMQEKVVAEPSQLEALRIIDTACQRGRGLVRSLTHFARPSIPVQIPIDLGMVIDELRLLLENTARKNVSMVEALAEAPTWILGDPGSFNSALMNLCLNSLDAMPDGGTLTFRTAILDPEWVEISIEDTGEGMTPEVLARVTEPFFTTKPVDKGTGLGLSITYGVITAHGGSMEITSQPGRGTQVRLRLPRIDARVGATSAGEPLQNLGLAKILVVDDEEEFLDLMKRMLKMAGAMQVDTASGGREALERLQTGYKPNLVILDENMPGMDGAQTLAVVQALYPDLPILMASGKADALESGRFRQDCVAFISKPFTLEEIQRRLGEMGIGSKPVLPDDGQGMK
jgi:PAS domain S-box-containing protein